LIASLIDQYCRQQVRSENLVYLKRFKRPRSQGHNHNALHASRSAIEEAPRYALSVTVTCCLLLIKSFQYYNRTITSTPITTPSPGASHPGASPQAASPQAASPQAASPQAASPQAASPQASPQTASITVAAPEAYDSAPAIYRRYVSDRDKWYSQQPQRCRTDKLYRKAMKLRLKYPKANHKWACGLSQMGSHVRASNGRKLRDWTEEEINAYIDFSNKEEERVYHTVAGQARYTGRRGIEDSMRAAEEDGRIQQAYYDNQIAM
ncbi:hypothetical protein HZ326_30793, partial [Fusarium oxysporum f. sp. albedinis]